MSEKAKPGTLAWNDLTVPNAEELRDFYSAVAGWTFTGHDMGAYQDFCMNASDGTPVAGICHARGSNANIPPQWLMYIVVQDIEACVTRCTELGGAVVDGPRSMGDKQFCVIRDPAGAVVGLITA